MPNLFYASALSQGQEVSGPWSRAFEKAVVRSVLSSNDPSWIMMLADVDNLSQESLKMIRDHESLSALLMWVSYPSVSWSDVESALADEHRPDVLIAAVRRPDVSASFLQKCRQSFSTRVRLAVMKSAKTPSSWVREDMRKLYDLNDAVVREQLFKAAHHSPVLASELISLEKPSYLPIEFYHLQLEEEALDIIVSNCTKMVRKGFSGTSSLPQPPDVIDSVAAYLKNMEPLIRNNREFFLSPSPSEKLLDFVSMLEPAYEALCSSYLFEQCPLLLGEVLLAHSLHLVEIFNRVKGIFADALSCETQTLLDLADLLEKEGSTPFYSLIACRLAQNPHLPSRAVIRMLEGPHGLNFNFKQSILHWPVEYSRLHESTLDDSFYKAAVRVYYALDSLPVVSADSKMDDIRLALAATEEGSPFMRNPVMMSALLRHLESDVLEKVVDRFPWQSVRSCGYGAVFTVFNNCSEDRREFFEVFETLEGSFVGTFGELMEACRSLS